MYVARWIALQVKMMTVTVPAMMLHVSSSDTQTVDHCLMCWSCTMLQIMHDGRCDIQTSMCWQQWQQEAKSVSKLV